MKSTTPLSAITDAARQGLSGNWGRSIVAFLLMQLLITGVSLACMNWLFSALLRLVCVRFFYLRSMARAGFQVFLPDSIISENHLRVLL